MTPGLPAPLSCSFCSAEQRHVQRLIAGPKVYICDQCVGLCVDIMAGEKVTNDQLKLHGSTQTIAELRERAEAAEGTQRAMRRAIVAALRGLSDSVGKLDTFITCFWCSASVADGDAAREHTATCEQHPAVIKLREIEASR